MCLFEGGAQGVDFVAVRFLSWSIWLVRASTTVSGSVGALLRRRSGLVAQVLDAAAQVLVAVEEGVRDAGFAADGLEGDRLAALDKGADGLLGGAGLGARTWPGRRR